MDNIELAKIKLDRAIRLAENFEELSSEDLRTLLLCLLRTLDALPKQNNEKLYWYSRISSLLNMELQRYGAIFKAMNWKNSVILQKQDLENMIWNVNSLLY